jgi:hypothetical protein
MRGHLPHELVHEGGCLCGAVRYRAVGEPSSATLCHCNSCRRAAGAPVVAWVTFPKSGFRFAAGGPMAYQSSPGVTRTFCGTCGTPLTYAHAHLPAGIDVTTCSLDDPEAIVPTDHIWTSDKLSWVQVNDHLPRFPETRDT